MISLLSPTFLQRLASPDVNTVLLCGCGGGFDFVHSMVLYPELRRLGKRVIIGSYSFGQPEQIGGDAPVVFQEGKALVRKVTARSEPPSRYGPEVHLCGFLDERYPDEAPHFIYAYYARAFSVPVLTRFYEQLIAEHGVDSIILVDGGSDSLMVGDEEGLGDPVEDAVSVATAAGLDGLALKLLISIGMGADRFNHVSDAATLRAVAELTREGGFWGSIGLEPDNPGLQFYRDCIDYIYARQSFRSVIVGMILSAAEGYFGGDEIPPLLESRVKPGSFFLWPPMAMLWAFDVSKVAARSRMVEWLRDCATPEACHIAVYQGRAEIEIRPVEDLPRHADSRYDPQKHGKP